MKHAYLIMAHNEPYILEKLLRLIDDERNDIYLHIDKKWKNFDFEKFKNVVKKSNIYFSDRLDVRWGTFKQIECELLLFEMASSNNKYAYYHLISGVDLPLVNQNVIHSFFEQHFGKEFIHFDFYDNVLSESLDRIKYYHLFVGNKRNSNKFVRYLFEKAYRIILRIQKTLKVNRLKNNMLAVRKGANWLSITDDLVRYILKQKKEIKKMFSFSLCADELFVQTIVYNSDFYKKVYKTKDNDYMSIKRYIDWKRGEPYTFCINDYDELINSNCFFARKFSVNIDKEIVDKIYDHVRGE